MKKLLAIGLTMAALGAASVFASERTESPSGATVYIVSPTDGETVSSPVNVVFGLQGMGVAPATVEHPKTGHHHLIIDSTVELAPGTHTLQLVLGDHNHAPHDPVVASQPITITVK